MLAKLDYPTLESIFYGIHNFEIPSDMAALMNSAEILALYVGIDYHKRKAMPVPDEFEKAVSALVGCAYKSQRFRSFAKASYKIFSTDPGDLISRMGFLGHDSRQEFWEALHVPRRYSNRENSENHDFYDPNCDGRSILAYITTLEIHPSIKTLKF